jgi:hypothetical protein
MMICLRQNGYLASREWLFACGKMVISATRKMKVNFLALLGNFHFKSHVRGANISHLYIVRSISYSRGEYIVFTFCVPSARDMPSARYVSHDISFGYDMFRFAER